MTAMMETRKAAIYTVLETAGDLSATTVNWIRDRIRDDQRINYTAAQIKSGLDSLIKEGFVELNKTLHRNYYHVA